MRDVEPLMHHMHNSTNVSDFSVSGLTKTSQYSSPMPRIYKNFRLSTFEYDTTGRHSVAVF